MAKNSFKPAPSGLNLGDIIYVLFKHKWKIALLTLLTGGAAAAYYMTVSIPYESESRLLVRYLVERSPLDRIDNTTGSSSGRDMDSIIQAETSILTSWTLAESVAENLAKPASDKAASPADAKDTAAKAAAKDEASKSESTGPITYAQLIGSGFDGEPSKAAAASAILRNLTVTAERGSSVISLSFRHTNPALPQQVLDTYVKLYFAKHLEIHRSRDTAEMAARAKDTATRELNEANDALKTQLDKYGIVSLTDGSQRFSTELASAQAELNRGKAALEEQTARFKVWDHLMGGDSKEPEAAPTADPKKAAAAGDSKKATASAPAPATPVATPQPDATLLENYRAIVSRLTQTRTNHDTLLLKYKSGHDEVKSLQSMISELASQRLEMEKKHPELLASAAAILAPAAGGGTSRFDLPTQQAELSAQQARVVQLQKTFNDAQTKAAEFSKDAPLIATAQRNLKMKEEAYQIFMTSWGKAQADTLLGASNIPNISTVQAPTPAAKNIKSRTQTVMGIALGGPIAGIALVLLFGLFLNRTIKRPLELEDAMGMPLLLSIPYFSRRSRLRACKPLGSAKTTKLLEVSESQKEPWEQNHFMHPFAESIRDRLNMHFEATGNQRKPKLIAVTGYSVGAGASTLAGGLAAALSEIGDGKVLLVDMNGNQGAAHPFFDGRPAISLTKALRLPPARGSAAAAPAPSPNGAGENLFVARADSPSYGSMTAGLRRMMPELKGSDFDYIVFDMPPLGQTKPTASMAGLMDKMLVIVEAEKNTRSEVRRGYRELVETGADVSMIFNKARAHGPKALVGNIS